jgi:hypothetical protein
LWSDADYNGHLILGAKRLIVFEKNDNHDEGPVNGKKK